MSLKQQIIDTTTGEVKTEKVLPENHNFVMLFRDQMPALRMIANENPKAQQLLLLLIENMDGANSLVASRETLAELLGHSRATVCRSIKYLKEKAIIDTSRTGNTVILHINAKIVWSSHANKKKYAKFSANVLISDSEQEKTISKTFCKTIRTTH